MMIVKKCVSMLVCLLLCVIALTPGQAHITSGEKRTQGDIHGDVREETPGCGCQDEGISDSMNQQYSEHHQYRTGLLVGGEPLPEGEIILGDPPAAWDWRSATYEGVTGDWTTGVHNQGNCGSCYAFGSLAAFESVINMKKKNPNYDIDLSEQFMVSCGTEWMSGIEGCDGAYATPTYNFLKTYGAIPESCFPYTSGSGSVPSCSQKCSNWQDLVIKIDSWYTIAADQTSIKNALIQYGPLSAGMAVYSDFYDYDGGVYEHPGSDPDPINHMVCIVGYNDAQGCWIVKNSWGSWWGENGWFRIKYGECKIEQAVVYFTYTDVSGPQLKVQMHRIKALGNIENWFEGGADWSYQISVNAGQGWVDQVNDAYSSNVDDQTQDVVHSFNARVVEPEIRIKVWDRDSLSGHDLADVSGYVGGGVDNDISDVRGAIFYGKYNIVTNSFIPVDTIQMDGGFITTSGTYAPDNSANSDDENDAMVWFKVSDTYTPPAPNLMVAGSLNGSVKYGTTHFYLGSFTVKNIGVDPEDLSDSYLNWEVAAYPSWGANWEFQPANGVNLKSGQTVTVKVYVDVPTEMNTFTGSIKVWNTADHSDYGIIPITLKTPRLLDGSGFSFLRFLFQYRLMKQ
ncbi:MAG: C1 family peptidase [Candidatus Thermoplasmatota archaeon]